MVVTTIASPSFMAPPPFDTSAGRAYGPARPLQRRVVQRGGRAARRRDLPPAATATAEEAEQEQEQVDEVEVQDQGTDDCTLLHGAGRNGKVAAGDALRIPGGQA